MSATPFFSIARPYGPSFGADIGDALLHYPHHQKYLLLLAAYFSVRGEQPEPSDDIKQHVAALLKAVVEKAPNASPSYQALYQLLATDPDVKPALQALTRPVLRGALIPPIVISAVLGIVAAIPMNTAPDVITSLLANPEFLPIKIALLACMLAGSSLFGYKIGVVERNHSLNEKLSPPGTIWAGPRSEKVIRATDSSGTGERMALVPPTLTRGLAGGGLRSYGTAS